MKKIFLIYLIFVSNSLFGQNIQIANQQAESFYNKVMPSMKPGLKNLVLSTAYKLTDHTVNPDSLTIALKNNKQAAGLQSYDIEALVMLIIMEASKDANQDLKDMLAEMKKNNDQKNQMRESNQLMKQQQLKIKDSLRKDYNTSTAIQTVKPKDSISKASTNISKIKLEDKKDSFADLNEEQQLRMQLYMERKNKAEAAISNLMKKIAETQNQIIQNLK